MVLGSGVGVEVTLTSGDSIKSISARLAITSQILTTGSGEVEIKIVPTSILEKVKSGIENNELCQYTTFVFSM